MDIKSSNEEFQKISGFIYALIECCKARSTDFNIPSNVIDDLKNLAT